MSRAATVRMAVAVAVVVGASIGGVASSSARTAKPAAGSTTVDWYSSLPLQGASSAQTVPIVNAIKLALKQAGNKAGPFTIKYTSLDDSTAAAGEWDPTKTQANAKQAASDSKAVFYIGEFNSGASEVSIPFLNTAGIAQLSPANTYAGLTVALPPATASGEPEKYYPKHTRTYFRIVPIDTIQGAADLEALQQKGCKKLAVANDGQAYGAGLAKVIGLEASHYGITVVYNKQIQTTSQDFTSVAQAIQAAGAQCFEFAGTTATAGTAVTKAVNAQQPSIWLLGPDGVCSADWAKGLSAATQKKMLCTVATLGVAGLPGGKKFLAGYTKAYHIAAAKVDPYAIYGYAAAQVGLAALKKIKPGGNLRSEMVAELHAIKAFNTVVGTFSFNAAGDTSSTSYGLYKFVGGNPVFLKGMHPSYILKAKA